ncbi:alpha-(1,3)-fucosyltransferase C-like [Ylistrum balloti]|uniref:alpha-(1,3)-fucosyltransferase C-like n=1 Tax=Ylistrum balloti TaxID=509963 RepID=UPI002905C5CB|nr:alpha-(1,3)-fucosyltransferase C-like [Ylistrum balloti]
MYLKYDLTCHVAFLYCLFTCRLSPNVWRLVFFTILVILLYAGVVTSYLWIWKTPSNASFREQEIRIHFYNRPPWTTKDTFKYCSHKCSISFGRNYQNYSTSQFVIFDGTTNLPRRPPKKLVGQTWIYHSLEPPSRQPGYDNWDRRINWTFSYRRDADFTHTYGTILCKDVYDTGKNPASKWMLKTLGNAWFVSHQNAASRRDQYARSLRQTVNVDIYSRYGSGKRCPSRTIKDCNALLSEKYNFYLAFENDLCRDYVTEKCYNIYSSEADVIPVVRGAPNYSVFLPPHSCLDTTKFKNISSLATFQLQLMKNQTAFESYFHWRRYFHFEPTGDRAFCQLCAMAHAIPLRRRLYDSLKKWVHGGKDVRICRKASDIK